MSRNNISETTSKTRAAWDASAKHHREAAYWAEWTAAASQPDFSVLDASLTETLLALNIDGKTAGQLCCNNARELLSLASLGARPLWGIDGSAAFLEQGAELARLSGQSPDLVCANVYDLPDVIPEVEILLITIGVLNWMPDLMRFFEITAGLIAAGGTLVIYETHPVLEMFDPDSEDPFTPSISYFEREAYVDTEAITYDGTAHAAETESYWFQHTMGEIVTAVANAGLHITRLTEHPHSNRETLYDRYEGRDAQVPMCFTLLAARSS